MTGERVLATTDRVLHRCGGWHGAASTCPCHLERYATGLSTPTRVPDTVHAVLATPGEALDESTRERLTARLGHRLGDVRLHCDASARRSAQDVAAAAYTVGQHVVLDSDRVPRTGTARDQVLAHELVHTVQNTAAGAQPGPPTAISRPDSPREREAAWRASGPPAAAPSTADRSGATTVHRQAAMSMPTTTATPDVGLGLTIREDGRIEVQASGPSLPVVGNPAVGLRRNADGTWEVLAGGTRKTVSAAEIPALLRSFAATSKPGAKTQVKVPSCRQLADVDGRPRSFDEYRINAILWPDTMPLTPALYQVMVDGCRTRERPDPTPLPPPPPAELQDLPAPSLPEGQAYA